MKKLLKLMRNILLGILVIIVIALVIILGINAVVRLKTRKYIKTMEQASELTDVDYIMVLGASVRNGDTPSAMLADRLDRGLDVYNVQSSAKLLMSGDRTDRYYDEVRVMKQYALDRGVAEASVVEDPMGYSTYDSMYRAKNEYNAKKMIIVTQRYHLYRAVYIARQMGIDAYGVAAEDIRYHDQWKRDIREILAIDKDFFKLLLIP